MFVGINRFLIKKLPVKELSEIQKINYYYMSREWPYKNVKKKIICEQYIGENLTDYKNYCFNGNFNIHLYGKINRGRMDGSRQLIFVERMTENGKKLQLILIIQAKMK